MAEFRARLFRPEDRGDITVPEVADLYLAALEERVMFGDYDGDALKNVRRYVRKFAAAHAHPVHDCAQADMSNWLSANPQWKSVNTKKNVCAAIIGCFVWAADEEGGALIQRNPYKRPKILKGIPYQPRRPADHSEYVALMRFGSKVLRRALFFLRRLGARTKEMRELEWPDVLLDCADPHVIVRNKTRRKTGIIKRKIGLDPATANWFRAFKRNCAGTGLVFRNTDNGPWDRHTFARHLRRYAERIGLDDGVADRVSAYCLRHTYAVDAIEGGVGDRQLADQLGHAKTDMIAAVYARHTRDKEKHLGNVARAVLAKRKRRKPEGGQ